MINQVISEKDKMKDVEKTIKEVMKTRKRKHQTAAKRDKK